MTQDGWRTLVLDAVDNMTHGDSSALNLLAEVLAAQDAAKNRLIGLGYGCVGMPWPEVVQEIAETEHRRDGLDTIRHCNKHNVFVPVDAACGECLKEARAQLQEAKAQR